jgi:hypothetical protein
MGDGNDAYSAGVTDDIVSIGRTFDGTQNVGFALSLTNTGVTSALYGDENNVAQFRVDERGRISFAQNVAITNNRNVATASSLFASRNIAATGDIAWNVDFKGHENVSGTATLATVNTSAGLPGPFGSSTVIPVISVNGKGLVTAVSTQNITTVPNALTANKLTTPRTFTLGEGGDDDIISIGRTFDGTQNVGFALTLKDAGAGEGNYGGENKLISLDLDAKGRVTGVTSTAIDFSLATVATADALTVSRKIKATNDISWEVDFKGDSDVEAEATLKTITTLPDDISAAFGSDTLIPKVKLDNKGRVIEIENVGIDFGTATVNQSNKIKVVENDNDSKHYLTFISSDSEPLSTAYYDLYGDDGLEYNPSSNLLSVENLSVRGDASVTDDLTVRGNTTLGSVNTIIDTVTFNAKVNSSILPSHDAETDDDSSGLDIGAVDKNFRVVYAKKFQGAVVGVSTGASQLTPGAAINLLGDVNATMTTPFTGNGEYTISGIALTTTSVTAGEYPNQEPTGLVPKFTVDSTGRLLEAGSYTPTLPSSNLELTDGRNTAILFNDNDSVGHAGGFSIRERVSGIGVGTIFDIDTVSSSTIGGGNPGTLPAIRYHGKLQNSTVLRISGNNNNYYADDGFSILYMGARPDNAASLSIFSDNQNVASQIEAINILQNGNTGFGVVQTSGSIAEHDIPATGGGVITAGKVKAREFEVTGNITVTNVTELTGIGFTNLGDTPTTYSGSNGRYVKVSGNELIFDTLSTGDVDGFNTEVNNLIDDSNISSSQITDLTTTIQNTDLSSSQITDLTTTIQNTNLSSSQVTDLTNTIQNTDLSSSQVTDLTTTINNTVNDTNTEYDLTARAGGATNQKIIRLSGTDGSNDDITIVASDGLSLTRSGNTLTLTNTDKGSSVSAGNNVSGGVQNRVLTSTGGNGIKGEPNLTFDGTNLHMQKNNGAIISNGNVIAYYTSDVTLKDNVQPIANALEKVSLISGNTFTWNDKAPKSILKFVGEEDTGVIAQEVNELGLPGVVKTKDDGTMGVRYEKLVPLLIEAIKELKEEVSDLRSQIGG